MASTHEDMTPSQDGNNDERVRQVAQVKLAALTRQGISPQPDNVKQCPFTKRALHQC